MRRQDQGNSIIAEATMEVEGEGVEAKASNVDPDHLR